MPRLKCTFGEFLEILKAHGFILHRHNGTSHAIYRKEDEKGVSFVTVAMHSSGEEIKPDTLRSMIRQSGLPKKIFRK
ncbi:type II toxin-antitoxin system HicA family toxin [Beijerinckia mobilis]|uniref:type II toxin-antitoxin system HicA family toxin n=1 Tax=Beijerinckia mobilis TaxID=231434 RepID=UPI0009FD681E|nr:type II toxin-antitoxin system HicA family toxin [Beijerinckia mobilis]